MILHPEADLDKEISAIIRFFDKDVSWSGVKKEIAKEVEKYLKKVLA